MPLVASIAVSSGVAVIGVDVGRGLHRDGVADELNLRRARTHERLRYRARGRAQQKAGNDCRCQYQPCMCSAPRHATLPPRSTHANPAPSSRRTTVAHARRHASSSICANVSTTENVKSRFREADACQPLATAGRHRKTNAASGSRLGEKVTGPPDSGPPFVRVRRPACWAGGHHDEAEATHAGADRPQVA